MFNAQYACHVLVLNSVSCNDLQYTKKKKKLQSEIVLDDPKKGTQSRATQCFNSIYCIILNVENLVQSRKNAKVMVSCYKCSQIHCNKITNTRMMDRPTTPNHLTQLLNEKRKKTTTTKSHLISGCLFLLFGFIAY